MGTERRHFWAESNLYLIALHCKSGNSERWERRGVGRRKIKADVDQMAGGHVCILGPLCLLAHPPSSQGCFFIIMQATNKVNCY